MVFSDDDEGAGSGCNDANREVEIGGEAIDDAEDAAESIEVRRGSRAADGS